MLLGQMLSLSTPVGFPVNMLLLKGEAATPCLVQIALLRIALLCPACQMVLLVCAGAGDTCEASDYVICDCAVEDLLQWHCDLLHKGHLLDSCRPTT
jgi:hypothetical protein